MSVAGLQDRVERLILRGGRFDPHWGWHDDHRPVDGTPEYKPALQQVRAEFTGMLGVLEEHLDLTASGRDLRCLQLGIGECNASHAVWEALFGHVLTIDWGLITYNDEILFQPGADTASDEAMEVAHQYAPYDFLFIDAGHSAEDARRDHANYGPMVRPGGIIAFHDALRRPGFEEAVQVWRYLETVRDPVNIIGDEVGVAWLKT